jgi:pyridoxamine 5'-phosphate oxidase
MIEHSIAALRQEYRLFELVESAVSSDPMQQFGAWFNDAEAAAVHEANAMTLATVSPTGQPSARTVLLKGLDQGFVFYTNYESRKGGDLAANPKAALLFFWKELERQVRVEGEVTKISREETGRYFTSRPAGSRLGALASPQSAVVANRASLEERFDQVAGSHPGDSIPLPDFWGGYRLTPTMFEFWQGRPNRLHDRLRYLPDDRGAWRIERLAP